MSPGDLQGRRLGSSERARGGRGRASRRRGRTPQDARRGAVLVLVMAAIVLLAVTVSLVTRRVILSRRALDSTVAVAQAESVWVTAAEIVRQTKETAELQFPLPSHGKQARRAIAEINDGERETWVIEVRIEEEGRVLARRRGTISVPESGASQ